MILHPGDLLLLSAFGSADVPAEERRALLDHLRDCSRCRKRLRHLLDRKPGPLARAVASRITAPFNADYAVAFDRSAYRAEAQRSALIQERREAPILLQRLLEQPDERRNLLLRNHPRFQTWSLTEALLERSAEEALRNVRTSEELARLALRLTSQLTPESYGTERIEDLKARSWARIGNSLRIRADLEEAEAAFTKAFRHLRRGTGDPLEKATCLDLKTSLLRALRRLQEAQRLGERAVAIFLEAGAAHLAGRALLNLETILAAAGDPEKGILVLYRAVALIDQEREPHLMFFASHNLVDNLSLTGRFTEAQGLLQQIRPLYERYATRTTQSRREWVEGRIAFHLGRRTEAKALLLKAHEGFMSEERYQEAAMVAAELCSSPLHRSH
jgi:tetratricopeptide (TPR) repeat protein